MRHHREDIGTHVMEMHEAMVQHALNHVRQNGLPHWRHSCSAAGPEHVQSTMQRRKWTEPQMHRYLRHYDEVIIADGHAKLNRAVCQHDAGIRAGHPQSGLNLPQQCPMTPAKGLQFCNVHGGSDGESEDADTPFEPVARRTRGQQVERVVSPDGCLKEFPVVRGHTTGVLVFARPCGVVVHLKELVMAESTHEVLHELWELYQRGVHTFASTKKIISYFIGSNLQCVV